MNGEHSPTLSESEHTLIALVRAALPLDDGKTIYRAPNVAPHAWPALVESAQQHGLAPLLFSALKHSDAPQPPAERIAALRASYVQTSARNWWAAQELGQWLQRFAERGLPVVVLKGSALAATLYPEPDTRPSGDLDLLIARQHVAAARALLGAHGYVPFTTSRGDDCELRFGQQLTFWRGGEQASQLDLHWHLFNSSYHARRVPGDWAWQHTQRMTLHAQPMQILAPGAQLLYLSTHYAAHQWRRLIWGCDLALLIARCAQQIDWHDLLETAAHFALVPLLQRTLARVCAQWGVAIPDEVSAQLRELRTSRTERFVCAALTTNQPETLLVMDALLTPGLKTKWQYVRCYAAPQAQYMRARYQVARPRWLVWYYLTRLWRGVWQVARSALTLWRQA